MKTTAAMVTVGSKRRSMKDAVRFETRGVLGGAYRGKSVCDRALLTHAIAIDAKGCDLFVLCRGPKLENIADSYAPGDRTLPATCPLCAERQRNELERRS
jgi:hypothetical protein